MGRLFAIGDVHGEAAALEALLTALDPGPDDVVVQLGDLCDRGPDVKRCFELLEEWSSRCRIEMVRGNHDEMMLDCCEGALSDCGFWLEVGGRETLASYGGAMGDVPEAHLQRIRDAAPLVITPEAILVHASLEPQVDLARQGPDWLRWKKTTGEEPAHPSGRRVVCGHTAQEDARPRVWPGWVCIDTRAYDPEGRLTALELGPDLVTQSDQSGLVYDPVPLDEIAVAV